MSSSRASRVFGLTRNGITPDIETEGRREALDLFAQAGANAPPPATIPAAGILAGGAGERVVGAQKLAVTRDEPRVLQRLAMLAARAGEDWYYRWPVKNKRTNKTEWIEGPSIKLANDVARLYGNDEVETRVIDLGDSWLIYARFTDYETGYSLTRPFQQRKSQRTMGERATAEDADRSRDIAFQIGVSKAIRNVTVNALQTFADYAFEEAKNSLIDKIGRDLPAWRDRTIQKLAAKVEIKRAEAVLGRAAGDWLAPDVAQVIAMMKAVSDGMATIDETFPPLAAKSPGGTPAGKLDEFATGDFGAPDQPPAGPETSRAGRGRGGRQPPSAALRGQAGGETKVTVKLNVERFTLTELAREAEREVILREAVYPDRIAAGKMRREHAERQIAMMREIARRLRVEADAQDRRLF